MTASRERSYNVLFICTGNSARSIMAECALNRWGAGKFQAYSAGSHPKGEVHPMTLRLLQDFNYPTEGLRSKDWQEFARAESPRSILRSPSVTRPRGKSARCGPGSP